MKPRLLLVMIVTQCGLCVALVLSLGWNIHQAHERAIAVDAAFDSGRVAGINWARSVIAAVAAQMAEDEARRESAEHAAEEKL